jgi:DnaK suppressor protein
VTTPKKAPVKAVSKAAKSVVAAQKKTKTAKPTATAKTASKTKPTKALPVKAKAAKAVPVKAKPVKAAPAKAKPAKAAPVKAKPTKSVPVKAKPAKAQPVKAKSKVAVVVQAKSKSPAVKSVVASAKPSSIQSSVAKEPSKKPVAAPQVKSMTVQTREAASAPIKPTPVTSAAPDQLVRAARPSARLAQITVPSLPPAVASTAAKSSFLPSSPSPAMSVPVAPIKKDPKLANNWKSKKVEQLSDAEILAMPDAEYMNDIQMAYFRRKLTILKQDILNSAGATTEHLREDTVVVPDPADRATIEEEHALELRTRDRERKLLKKIEQSIQRIDAGDYGFCDETGEAIGVGRLLARPTATLSLEAQQRRELKQKMFGD